MVSARTGSELPAEIELLVGTLIFSRVSSNRGSRSGFAGTPEPAAKKWFAHGDTLTGFDAGYKLKGMCLCVGFAVEPY